MHRILPFAAAGAIGFAVDAVVLMAVIGTLGPLAGRILSFACAVATTWLINRNFAFADRPTSDRKRVEFGRYLVAMLPGTGLNWLAYAAVTLLISNADWAPLAAVAAGSLAGMATNLLAAQALVFRLRA